MMPAAKHLDPILGLDIHIIQPPGPVPPLPIPHPHIGIVMDPMDYAPIIERLRQVGYGGYLSIECLYPKAKKEDPQGSVAHDLEILRELLSK